MRALLVLLPAILAGCGSSTVTQRQILKQSQLEIASREPWSDTAVIIVENHDDFSRLTWKVKAGAFDYSDYPSYNGIQFVPGTERQLRFTREGCLLDYSDRGNPCLTATSSGAMLMVPQK